MKWMSAMVGLAGLAFSTRSEIVVAPVVVERVIHNFSTSTDPEFPNYGGETFQFNAIPFTANLDADTELSYTLRAPSGQKFQIGDRGGAIYIDLKFGIESGPMSRATIQMTLENPSGTTPEFGDGLLLLYGNEIRTYSSAVGSGFARFGGVAGGFPPMMEFTAMTLHLIYPQRNDGTGVRTFSFTGGSVITSYFTPSEDPGPIVSLVAIPEPATAAIWVETGLAVAGAGWLKRRRRKTQRIWSSLRGFGVVGGRF